MLSHVSKIVYSRWSGFSRLHVLNKWHTRPLCNFKIRQISMYIYCKAVFLKSLLYYLLMLPNFILKSWHCIESDSVIMFFEFILTICGIFELLFNSTLCAFNYFYYRYLFCQILFAHWFCFNDIWYLLVGDI